MTAKPKKFPLNFDAPTWSIEEAVPWIFFGDSCEEQSWGQVTKLAVGYVAGEVDDGCLKKNQSEAFAAIQKPLRALGVLSRGTGFSSLIWCRIAIQFWLEHGGRQQKFISAMTRWVKAKSKGGVAVVRYTNDDHPDGQEMPLEVFLFDTIDDSTILKTEWGYRNLSANATTTPKTKLPAKRSAESQVGSNLLAAVKVAVQNLKNGRRGENLFLRKSDPVSGKLRFIGTREDLYQGIYKISTDISGMRHLNKGQQKERYSKASVIKAISIVAICRRSWGKKSGR